MKERHRHNTRRLGMPPGTLLREGAQRSEAVQIRRLAYSLEECTEENFKRVDDFLSSPCKLPAQWIHITGIPSVEVLEKIGEAFNVHSLILEDVSNSNHYPKAEENTDQMYIVLKLLNHQPGSEKIDFAQISIVVGENYIISFQENDYDAFKPVRERLHHVSGKIRSKGVDYLTYALLDCIVDHYYVVLEYLGEKIEDLENQIMLQPKADSMQIIHSLKMEMLYVRKAVWPVREIINTLARGDSRLFGEETVMYLRDVYDHIIQVIDSVEIYRDMVTNLFDIYISSVSYKLNEIMKVLTVISTVFIPLTFVAGVYGMNFKYMPELEWEWGYPAVLFGMALLSALMMCYFHRRRWLA